MRWRRDSCVLSGFLDVICSRLEGLIKGLNPYLCLLVVPQGRIEECFVFFSETCGAPGHADAAAIHPRAHSMRRVSTSLDFVRHWLVTKVFEAATWRSSSVSFFYLEGTVCIMFLRVVTSSALLSQLRTCWGSSLD